MALAACRSATLVASDASVPATSDSSTIRKPRGVFSSAGATSTSVLNSTTNRGVLIRVYWREIETTEGSFNFAAIDQQVAAVKAAGKQYSLAVLAGGIGSPSWLIDQRGVPYFNYLFRGAPFRLPLPWNDIALSYLGKLATALGQRYAADSSLALVYVPQMSANGIEGHLNGFSQSEFSAAGYSEATWVNATLRNVKQFAMAFAQKPLAIEVHELFGSAAPAADIINGAWNDSTLHHRVGAAMWWISGNSTYQPALLSVLESFRGDLYCQIIDRSDNAGSFPLNDYSKVFAQAKALRARYIEPWDVEFSDTRWSALFRDFNSFADTLRKN